MYEPQEEQMPRERLRQLQLERLQGVLRRVEERVPFYREAFAAAGVQARAMRSLADLERFPFTRRADLRDRYPFGFLAVPLDQVARVHATSGTRGKPTLVAYTRADLETWARLCARLLRAAGCRPGDALHIALNYGLFTGGLGVHGGAERLGCTVIPAASGGTHRQITLLADLRPAGLKATPSYALHLAETAVELGVDPRSFGLRFGIFGAEPWSEAARAELERRFGCAAYDSYGLSEMLGPGVAFECQERAGLHLSEDHFLPEVIDPETGRVLPPGEEGELVLTSLTKEAMPLVRYRTGDRTALIPDPCRCGRTSLRMARVRGRVDEMLILRGVNLFPSEVERVLLGFPEIAPHYQVRIWREGALDAAEVRAELRPGVPAAAAERLPGAIGQALRAELGAGLPVRVGAPGSLPRSEGRNKALRVIDERGGEGGAGSHGRTG